MFGQAVWLSVNIVLTILLITSSDLLGYVAVLLEGRVTHCYRSVCHMRVCDSRTCSPHSATYSNVETVKIAKYCSLRELTAMNWSF